MLLELKKVHISEREKAVLLDVASNWDKLHRWMQGQPKDKLSDTTLKLLKLEVEGRRRLLLANRLLGIYHGLARRSNAAALLESLTKNRRIR